MLTVGSLFSGIGGMDLGLERAGMRVIWQSEIDPYASAVLKKHWPHVPNLGDITKIDWSRVEQPDLVCGGFPCQPFSVAGKRAGESDARNLWPETIRCLRELRPRLALLENVPGLLAHQYFGRILGDLAESGYLAEWDCISASAVGAPHRRDRLWIVAHADRTGRGERRGPVAVRPEQPPAQYAQYGGETLAYADCCGGGVGDTTSARQLAGKSCACGSVRDEARRAQPERRSGRKSHVSDADRGRCDGRGESEPGGIESAPGQQPDGRRCEQGPETPWAFDPADADPESKSYVGRVAHGVPSRVDRLRCLGNAVVPQVAEYIGRRIVTALERA